MLAWIYQASLAVIVIAAVLLALDQRIQTGIVGTAALGGVAVFSVAAADVADPPNWLVGQTASLAGAALWAVTRATWHKYGARRRAKKARA